MRRWEVIRILRWSSRRRIGESETGRTGDPSPLFSHSPFPRFSVSLFPDMSQILDGTDPQAIAIAVALLRAGEVVAFPTETVYGLGANALNERAVAQVFAIKNRPHFDPLIVHVPDKDVVALYATGIDERAVALMERFWPGPLTLVLQKRPNIPDLVTAGLDTVAIRVPSHPVALALLHAANLRYCMWQRRQLLRPVPIRLDMSVRPLHYMSRSCLATLFH
jgi:hypothetical protein